MSLSNDISRLKRSRSRMDQWAAFDLLPPQLRAALQEVNVDYCCVCTLRDFHRFRRRGLSMAESADHVIVSLLSGEDEDIALFDRSWRKAGHGPYPHAAANATILRYEEARHVRAGRRPAA